MTFETGAPCRQRQESDDLPDGAIDGALHRAAAAVEAWPAEDLFERLAR